MHMPPDPLRVTPDDPQLKRLIQAERVRMLFGASLPVELVSSVFAVALAALIGQEVGWRKAIGWAVACLLVSAVRRIVYRCYRRAPDRAAGHWLNMAVTMAGLLGAVWGLGAAWLLPLHNLDVAAVIVGALLGASAVCTFALQAHERPGLVLNVLLLTPTAIELFMRQDRYGVFGGAGMLTLLGVMLLEGHRASRRITELLWLRFTTDQIAQQRADALKLAQRHAAVKDQFLATMSHEMRTPLHGILGLARLVHGKLPPKPGVLAESREHMALIERSGEHLLRIINDVLDFSRIEAGKLQIDAQPFALRAVIDDVLSLLAVTAAEKGLPVHAEVDLPGQALVLGDAARVRQVLHNLLGNAVKFTELGEVRLQVARHGCDDDDGPCARRIVFTVKDTGVGIAPDQLPMVFEAFHQADGSFGRRHQGTGLGLTISREIARAMGGDILCESTLGQGSTFTLILPLPAVPAQAETAPPVSAEAPASPGASWSAPAPPEAAAPAIPPVVHDADDPQAPLWGHVLLAEDNEVNAVVAIEALRQLGLEVTHVEDGQQALHRLQDPDHGFDVVLMDCQMPWLDGIEATRRLRCLEQAQGRALVPVIALTANVMGSDRDRCRAAGMDAHLPKPFAIETLRQLLRLYLQPKVGSVTPA